MEFLNTLATVWAKYRGLGYITPTGCKSKVRIANTWSLLVDPNISQDDVMKRFTSVAIIVTVTENGVKFLDGSGETLYATIDCTGAERKLMSMTIKCPVCFGDPHMPPCSICDGAGKM
jgi:hypothetical protein